MTEKIPVVHSKSVGRRQAVLNGRDPAGEMITKVELDSLRRKAAAYDAGESGWVVKGENDLILITFDHRKDRVEAERNRVARAFRGTFSVVPCRIVQGVQP